jgi:16S rRNA processing protein RimM
MEKKRFLESGRISNTHGIRGEVKIEPWCDSADFLCGFKKLYINNNPFNVLASYVHKKSVIALFEGVSDINAAMRLKGSTVYIDREDVKLGKGEYFIADIIGLPVIDEESGEKIGELADVLEYPASRVYVVSGEKERLIPAVPEFVKKVDLESGAIYVRLIEGM